ncbi:hypothetical protein [Halovivax limisalsi]|uniref:hypothetical protein n=1 Tax=Halovivax limisalsi TaxID=1453760 RepID=UPI001FFCD777|nr:hypothetical protein [Halovivax limisalsi]
MPARLISVLRSVAAAVSLIGFVIAFVAARSAAATPRLVLAAAAIGAISLCAAVGPRGLLWLVGLDVDRKNRGENYRNGGGEGDRHGGGKNDEGDRSDESAWWPTRFEPTVDEVWDRQADYALAVGLAVVGVGALALFAIEPGDEIPTHLLVLALICLNGSLFALAGAAMNE